MLIRITRTIFIAMALSLILTLLSATPIVAGGVVNVPQTGQTTCYNGSGSTIACANSGEDGEKLAGVPGPGTRFTVNASDSNNTVTDNFTGLVWFKDASTPALGCTGGTRTLQQALAYITCINGASAYGHNDWRLPNIDELRSLINRQTSNPMNGTPFVSVQSNDYWSSTTDVHNTKWAWLINMTDGRDDLLSKSATPYYVWPVRGVSNTATNNANIPKTGQTSCYDSSGGTFNTISCTNTGQDGDILAGVSWPSTRFTNNGDNTVTDGLTGLMWAKDASTPNSIACNTALATGCSTNTSAGSGTYCYGGVTPWSGGTLSWGGALLYVQCLNANKYLCYDDWRLPNVNELQSLANYQQDPVYTWLNLPGQGFSNVNGNYYWSSTTYVPDTAQAWEVEMGHVYDYHAAMNSGLNYTWPVRGGQSGTYPATDISVTQSGTSTVNYSGSATYTLTVTNTSGSNSATDVYVIDTLPTGSTYVSATPTHGTCCQSGSLLKCAIGTMSANASYTITVNVTAPSTVGTISNAASVSTQSNDSTVTSNNASSFNTAVTTTTTTAVVSSSPSNTSGSGSSVTFTATVTPTGGGGGSPTGTITFKDGSSAISGCSSVAMASGGATCTTSVLSIGSHSITAVYGGDTNDVGSTSSPLTQTVNAAAPSVTTTDLSNKTATSVSSGGTVTSDGGATVTAEGVCWGTTAHPTISSGNNPGTCTSDGTATPFTSSITGLTKGNTYYVRAYATNSTGTGYGNDVQYVSASAPSVTTTAVSNLAMTTASSGGTVTSDGGAAVTAEGVCWGATASPTISSGNNPGTCTSDGTSTPFTSSITGLTKGTTYHVSAYATNSTGTGYGDDVQFTTAATTDSVTYRFPYFHTAAANAIFCVASNVTSQAAAVSFQPKAGGVYNASKFTSVSLGTLKANGTDMFTFTGSTATSLAGGANATISGPDNSAKGSFYGPELVFTASTSGTVNCNTITIACFQGSSTPKRNLIGYVCMDANSGFVSY